MSSSNGSSGDGTGATPAPITAPAAPRQLAAPHNLFTLTEVTEALRLLAVGLGEYEELSVSAYWRNDGRKYINIEDLTRIADVEDVYNVFLSWRYHDGSRVVGSLVDRPRAGTLSIEGGGQALASAQNCLDHLRGRRAQRARLRGFVAGRGLAVLCAILSLVVAFACFGFLAARWAYTSAPAASITPTQLVVSAIGGFVIGTTNLAGLRFLRRRRGGTRLARQHQVDQSLLTTEVGVFAALAGVVVAFLALVVAVIALL